LVVGVQGLLSICKIVKYKALISFWGLVVYDRMIVDLFAG
jgi:hypothetical protein